MRLWRETGKAQSWGSAEQATNELTRCKRCEAVCFQVACIGVSRFDVSRSAVVLYRPVRQCRKDGLRSATSAPSMGHPRSSEMPVGPTSNRGIVLVRVPVL